VAINQTHLYEFHRANGSLINFAGFQMPIWYTGIIQEHMAVRNSVGIFDVTHMGRCLLEGKDATAFLNYSNTRDLSSLHVSFGKYCLLCNDLGGIVDDLVVFCLAENKFLLIYNACNRVKDVDWMNKQARDFQITINDVSDKVAMFAVQGPNAINTLQPMVNIDLSSMRHFSGKWTTIGNRRLFVTRTGYTGEDGFELLLWDTPLSHPDEAINLWQAVINEGKKFGILPCGLGARDTLRLEAGFLLYGNDINERITPLEAGLDFAVQLEKANFVGKTALVDKRSKGIEQIRVSLKAFNQRVPRAGSAIFYGDQKIGYVTSGTFSPLLKRGIGIGYISTACKQIAANMYVKTKQSIVPVEPAEVPFYDKTMYGRERLSFGCKRALNRQRFSKIINESN
jgi:aminomethyltransferase